MKKITGFILALILFVLPAVVFSAEVELTPRSGDAKYTGYHTSTVIADTASTYFVIPHFRDGFRPITVTLLAGANTGKVQYTTSSVTAIRAETAVWHDWDYGDVSGNDNTDVLTGPVTGLQGVSVSGEVTIEIVY
jgi:hypothetical protein